MGSVSWSQIRSRMSSDDASTLGGSAGGSDAAAGSVLRSSALMALGTIVSRLTGFARNVVVVAALGSALFADAYNVANTIPNILYILLVGGALNAVFVPQVVRAMKEDPDGGAAYANRLLTASMTLLLAITVTAVAVAPLIVDLYADFTGAQRSLAVTFARYFLPQILFYGLFTMLGQILNARDRFGPMMWTPVLNNLVVIATFATYMMIAGTARSAAEISPEQTRLLGIGTTLGIVIQALALIPSLRRAGFRWRPRFDWHRAGLGKTARLGMWLVLVVVVNQIGYWVVTRLSTTVSVLAERQGIEYGVGYTAYSNAHLLWLLPQGVITVSLLTAIMPRISRTAVAGNLKAVSDDVSYAVRLSGTAVVPAAFFFLSLGPHITTVVFLHGNMTLQDTYAIGYMLMAFGLGLIPFSAQYLLARTFYALEDTRTPFSIAAGITATHAALSLVSFALLPVRWAVTGMAAGYGIAYTVGLWMTVRKLSARLHHFDGRRLVRFHARLTTASASAAVAALGASQIAVSLLGEGFGTSLVALTLGGTTFLAIYLLIGRLLHIDEISMLVRAFARRARRAR
jgi:putative peptidoglycan lipid II flippase